jgi:hypothetical protein
MVTEQTDAEQPREQAQTEASDQLVTVATAAAAAGGVIAAAGGVIAAAAAAVAVTGA